MNWSRDDAASLSTASQDSSVEAYLRRCHECELDVIGITDHNFLAPVYIDALKRKNSLVAQQMGRHPLIIFPGFEIEISTGLGVHLLCLFNPDTDLNVIDDIVTRLNLPRNKRRTSSKILPSSSGFDDVLRIVQEEAGGIVIAAHPMSASGLLNDKFITEYFQREMFVDPRLLAMEAPCPVDDLRPGWQKLIRGGTDCDPNWRRQHPIATVMSSDAYRLYPARDDRGYIGKRYTWIKMSHPSVESLRQAFLDHASRIRLHEASPELLETHGRIVSLEIKNTKFLTDQKIFFSPNLNCIIGSRGAGKSSIIEYIRMCTNREPDRHAEPQVDRVKQTLNDESTVEVKWRGPDGLEEDFRFSVSSGLSEVVTPNREVFDSKTIFANLGIQIFSQRQLSSMTHDLTSILPLLDSMDTTGELDAQRHDENATIASIRERLQKQALIQTKHAELRKVKQELTDLQRRWDAAQTVHAFAEQLQRANEADGYLQQVKLTAERTSQQIMALADDLDHFQWPQADYANWPLPDFFANVAETLENAQKVLVDSLRKATQRYLATLNTEIFSSPSHEEVAVAVVTAANEFSRACEAQGVTEEELENLRSIEAIRREKRATYDRLAKEIAQLESEVQDLQGLYNQLFQIWKWQTRIRTEIASNILSSSSMMRVPVGAAPEAQRPFVDIVITYCGDKEHFSMIWNQITPNRRTRLGRAWEIIGESIYRSFLERQSENSPWQILTIWKNNPDTRPNDVDDYWPELEQHIAANESVFEDLQMRRVNDQVDFVLYRSDGSRAGSFQDGTLSDGQRNTVMLAVLLAQGSGPIIIDQPEEELDSDFIYNELVPVLRGIKNSRQVILATHNANLPVNGDAELVYALRTETGRGNYLCDGGLDQTRVKKAVLDIMEGSEEAFRRRSEKYHF